MPISNLTAIIIQNRGEDVYADAGGPSENGKYTGWILLKESRFHPLLNSEPVYDTFDEAKCAMEDLIMEIRKGVQIET